MDASLKNILAPLLTTEEAKRKFPYDDKTGRTFKTGDTLQGKLSIGIGRNLTDKGLNDDEISLCFANDLNEAEKSAICAVGTVFYSLSFVRQAVLVDMAFNMGLKGLCGFTNTLQAIRDGNYAYAAANMRKSLWARQVGQRAEHLAMMMEKG